MKIITRVEIVWSIHVFFFRPAQMPSKMPRGTEITTEIIFKYMETGNLCKIMLMAEALSLICVERPQSHLVTMFLSQLKYKSIIGVLYQ